MELQAEHPNAHMTVVTDDDMNLKLRWLETANALVSGTCFNSLLALVGVMPVSATVVLVSINN